MFGDQQQGLEWPKASKMQTREEVDKKCYNNKKKENLTLRLHCQRGYNQAVQMQVCLPAAREAYMRRLG
jgi:hypothetical protein